MLMRWRRKSKIRLLSFTHSCNILNNLPSFYFMLPSLHLPITPPSQDYTVLSLQPYCPITTTILSYHYSLLSFHLHRITLSYHYSLLLLHLHKTTLYYHSTFTRLACPITTTGLSITSASYIHTPLLQCGPFTTCITQIKLLCALQAFLSSTFSEGTTHDQSTKLW